MRIKSLIYDDRVAVGITNLRDAARNGRIGQDYAILLGRGQPEADLLELIAHEGQHILDDIDGLHSLDIPDAVGEARACGAGMEFAAANQYWSSGHGNWLGKVDSALTMIIERYAFKESDRNSMRKAIDQFLSGIQ